MRRTIFPIILMFACLIASGQQKDTTSVKKNARSEEGENRNIMLNASSSTKPREISIGLPSTQAGTEIYEDGLLVGYYFWPMSHDAHWRGGESYGTISTMSIGENAIMSGNVGYAVNSFTRLGEDEFHGSAAFRTDQFGLMRYDLNITGPLGKGFYFNAGGFLNFDPGSCKVPFIKYQDNTKIFKVGLTKRWDDGRGEVSVHYKHYNSDTPSFAGTAPFYYEGDGTISLYNGFRLGHDNFVPADNYFQYLDMKTGKMESDRFSDVNWRHGHDALLRFKYDFENGMKFTFSSKFGYGRKASVGMFATGLDQCEYASGYQLKDGTPFKGDLQSRMSLYFRNGYKEFCNTAELSGTAGKNNWRVGVNSFWDWQDVLGSTSSFAHTVEKDPVHLYKNGDMFWNFNSSGEYFEGTESKNVIYATNDWTPSPRFNLYYGLRMEVYNLAVQGAFADYDNPLNNRVEGFSLVKPGVTVEKFHHTWLNPIGTVNAVYKLTDKFGLAGDYLFVRQHPRLEHFSIGFPSNLDPVDVHLARFGVTYDNSWLKLTSMLSYIYKTNNKEQTRFYKMINGVNEIQVRLMSFDIATLGWTTDAVLTPFEHFSLHLLATLQKPEYKNYATTLTFSDGVPQKYDYSGKIVKGIPRILMEIDPSYSIDKWRFWLSARYYGKHFANMPNNVYFNGHWETFGGIDFKYNQHISASLNLINILNQSGANGTIAAADLMTDTSLLNHYLMSGSYIRPFTMELSLRLAF